MQKDTQHGIKLQTTPRDGAEHGEGEADAQGTGGKEHDTTTQYLQGTGLLVEAVKGRRAGVRMVESERERKGNLDGRTLRPTGT